MTSAFRTTDAAPKRRDGRLAKLIRRCFLGDARRNAGGFVSVGVIVATVLAMVGTLFGVGAVSRALDLHDGNIWFWDSGRGEASRVNAAAGRIDMRRSMSDAQGHRVRVIQNDEHLLLQDLDAGTVTSLDLATLNVSGVVSTDKQADIRVGLYEGEAFLVDAANGIVRQLDASNLEPVGRPLKTPKYLAGGDFDDKGRFWVGSPASGEVLAIKPGKAGNGPELERKVDIGHNNRPWSVSVLDDGVSIVDRFTTDFIVVNGQGAISRTTIAAVGETATMPTRVRGDVVPITSPGERKVVIVQGSGISEGTANGATSKVLPIPGSGQKLGTAVAFVDRLYIPDQDANVIRVIDLTGNTVEDINAAGGRVEMENRENHLVINADGTDKAWVVDEHHKLTELQKAPKDVVQGDGNKKPGDNPNQPNGNGNGNGNQNPNQNEQPGGPQISKPSQDPTSPPSQDPAPQNPNPGPNPTPGPPTPTPSQPPQASKPGTPGSPTARAGDSSATLSWFAADPKGSAIKRYVVTGGPRELTVAGDATSINITGLTNGTTYDFLVRAENDKGAGDAAKANPVTPTAVIPQAPTAVQASANANGSITVAWQPSNANGGVVQSYQVRGITNTAGGELNITGITETSVQIPSASLAMGASYTFTVTAVATNGATSRPSAASNPVTTFSKPGAPGAVAASPDGPGVLLVQWSPAAPNGKPITSYTVTLSNGVTRSVAGTQTSIRITGLPAGPMSVYVTASNDAGSTRSTTVTATVAGAPTPTPTPTPKPTPTPTPTPEPVTAAGVVRCVSEGTANPDYCTGIRTFSQPNQQSTPKEVLQNGTRATVTCKIKGENITSWIYNNNKESTWWLKLKSSGSYIPYAWFNLTGGDDALTSLKSC